MWEGAIPTGSTFFSGDHTAAAHYLLGWTVCNALRLMKAVGENER